jgi:hypothetical protein
MGAAYFVLRTSLGLADLLTGKAGESQARDQLRSALAPFAQQPETAATRQARAVLVGDCCNVSASALPTLSRSETAPSVPGMGMN